MTGTNLGKLAVERGLITPDQLQAASADPARDLSDVLVERGFITASQRDSLLSQTAFTVEPASFGKYKLIRELGRGGMGVVHEALDTVLNRRVALKMVLTHAAANPERAKMEEERFLREAQLAANLEKHPHIVGVYEAGVIDGRRYLAMEFIQGMSMSEWNRGKTATQRQQIALLRDVALAVHHAHESGVIHRDLKPANVLVDAKNMPHVTDFGLARAADPGSHVSLTGSGMMVGTPAYMSPEQAQAFKNIDRRTDVYSLGVMLYEVLAGRTPFSGEAPIEILMKVVANPPPPPSTIVPDVERDLDDVCIKSLAKDPNERYPSARALADDLTKWLGGEEVTVVLPKVRGKRFAPWIAAALGLVVAGIAAMTWPEKPKLPAWPALAMRMEIKAHEGGVNSLAFSPGNDLLATGSADTSVRIIDVTSGKMLHHITGHAGKVEAVAFSPDGKSLVAVTEIEKENGGGEIKCWDPATGQLRWEITGQETPMNCVAFSRDGLRMATGSQDGAIRVWDVAKRLEISVLSGHLSPVRGIAFSRDAGRLVSTSHDGSSRVWDLKTATQVHSFHVDEHGSWGLALSEDDRILATAGSDKTIRLWDVQKREAEESMHGHTETVQNVAFLPGGRHLVSTSRDKTVRIWDLRSRTAAPDPRRHETVAWGLAVSPDGKIVASGDMSGTVRLWNVSP